jgi:xylulokinase
VLDTGHGEPLVETHCYPSGGYFVENPGWLSGGARRWAIDLLGLVDDDELDRCAASAPPGADGVVFVPALAGAMSPVWRPGARATLHGLTAAHTRAHVARAVLEGLAFATRDVVARLRRLVPSTTRVVALGGGARSQLWMQIRADALDLPHLHSPVIDSAPLGAALIASVACGWYGDLASAARSVPAPVLAATPQRDPLLREAYARYATLVDTLVR